MTRKAAKLSVETCSSLGDVAPEWDRLFALGPDLQSSRAWFAASIAAALPPGHEPRFVMVRKRGVPAALLPMQVGPDRRWRSLTTPYTCAFQPLLEPSSGITPAEAGCAFGRTVRGRGVTVFEALDPDWSGLAGLRAGLRRAGLISRTFAHFGNWHEPAPGSWAAYLAARPGQLRETIRRKLRAAERDPQLRLEMVADPERLPAALRAYEDVYARSWKQSEPHPRFNEALVAALGNGVALRFALMWAAGRPIAAQYWTVHGGVATVLKLAHDDEAKAVSPGTVLTAFAIRRFIEEDGVGTLDFGRGDDAYKQGWARERRQRVGLAIFDPLTLRGAAGLLRHDGGSFCRSAQFWLRGPPRSKV